MIMRRKQLLHSQNKRGRRGIFVCNRFSLSSSSQHAAGRGRSWQLGKVVDAHNTNWMARSLASYSAQFIIGCLDAREDLVNDVSDNQLGSLSCCCGFGAVIDSVRKFFFCDWNCTAFGLTEKFLKRSDLMKKLLLQSSSEFLSVAILASERTNNTTFRRRFVASARKHFLTRGSSPSSDTICEQDKKSTFNSLNWPARSSREALSSPESQITKKNWKREMKLIGIYGNHKTDTRAWSEGTSTRGNPANRKHIFMISHDNSTLLELDAFSRQKCTVLSINPYLPSLINNRREIKRRRGMKFARQMLL